jgi:hypothetical protein
VPKATVLGISERVIKDDIDRINSITKSGVQSVAKAPRQIRNEGLYDKLLQGKLDHLKKEDRQHIEPMLKRYIRVFHDEEVNNFKATYVIEHKMAVGDARPIRRHPYRTPYALREEMQKQVQEMLKKGVIRESKSSWSAPAILVPKMSLDGTPKFRFCVDFRALNAVTKFDKSTSTLLGSR